ncbi:MAG: DUF3987 domain-containing protein [Kiritimatiellae bacterium]|nr:DUF3987 domain-containing protein [Kiritimatiellia bacterium]
MTEEKLYDHTRKDSEPAPTAEENMGSLIQRGLALPLADIERVIDRPLAKGHQGGELPDWAVRDLAKSGITAQRAVELGIRHVQPAEYPALLGIDANGLSDGYFIPFRDPATGRPSKLADGREYGRVRLRETAACKDSKTGKPSTMKYVSPQGAGQRAYIRPEVHEALLDSGVPVVATEGEKKSIAATDAGIPVVGLAGNWGWIKDKDLLPELKVYATPDRVWTVIWDSDAAENPAFEQSTNRLAEVLATYGCTLKALVLPALGSGKTGVDDFLSHPNGGAEKLKALIEGEAEDVNASCDWPDIGEAPQYDLLPEFPIYAMPEVLGNIASEITKSDQVSVEVASLALMVTVGFAAGNAYKAAIKQGISARPNLYAMVFVPLAERKSTVFRRVLAPVETWISGRRLDWERTRDSIQVHERRMDALRKQISNINADPAEQQAYLEQLEAERAQRPVGRSPYLLADDTTPEEMVVQMASTGGRLGIFSDDARQYLQILTGRYADGRCQESIFLKAYDGTSPIRSGRRSRETITIEDPCAGILVFVQNDWLGELGRHTDLSESGFNSRTFFCVPESLAGARDADGHLRRAYTDYEVNPDVAAAYGSLVTTLLDQSFETQAPRVLDIAEPAKTLWIDFYNQIEAELGVEGDLRHIADLAKRYPVQALRLALIHTICRSGDRVSLQDMSGGIELALYFAHHGERAFQTMRSSFLPHNPGRIVDFLRRHRKSDFRLAELQRAIGGMDRDEVREAVHWLVDNGYARETKQFQAGRGRKASPRFIVNPHVHAGRGE